MGLKMLTFFAASSFVAWILLFSGIGWRRESRLRSEREHTRTTGTIVGYAVRQSRAGKGGAIVRQIPVIEFTAEGEKYRLEYENGIRQDEHPIGEVVDILYDVSDPSRFHLESDPAFTNPGGGAIRVAVIWILVSAALTVALAVFVGGASFDHLRFEIRRFLFMLGRR